MPITDDRVQGFTTHTVEALRYDNFSSDPYETPGIILSMIPNNARVLDVGCGTGSVTALIRDMRNAEVIGIEPHTARAEHAERQGLQVINAELTEEMIKELGTFDVVVFIDVLEHLVDPAAMLLLVRQAVRENGSILISVPNVAHWTIRLNLMRGQFDYEPTGIMDATHLRWFTETGIRRLFEATGFEIKQQSVSSGTWLSVYNCKRPWKWMKPRLRLFVIHKAAKIWPALFGCQHLIRAVPV